MAYDSVIRQLSANPRVSLVTGVARFIGSNLSDALLRLNPNIIRLDSCAMGDPRNLDEATALVGDEKAAVSGLWKAKFAIRPPVDRS